MPSYIYLVREGFSVGREGFNEGRGRLCQLGVSRRGLLTYLRLFWEGKNRRREINNSRGGQTPHEGWDQSY